MFDDVNDCRSCKYGESSVTNHIVEDPDYCVYVCFNEKADTYREYVDLVTEEKFFCSFYEEY